jgi:ATP-dependent DNA ligase
MKALPRIGFMLIGTSLSPGKNVSGELDSLESEYLLEPKVDDIRSMMFFLDGGIRMQSRAYNEQTQSFPQFKRFYKRSLEGTVLDGGLVARVSTQSPWKGNFPLMLSINGSLPERAVAVQERYGHAQYVIFDIIKYKGKSTTCLPLETRLQMCDDLGDSFGNSSLMLSLPHYEKDFYKRYLRIVNNEGEGVVLKKRGSIYEFGRSSMWMRIKRFEDVVCWLSGRATGGAGKYSGMVGSVEVIDEWGKRLAFVSGFPDNIRKALSSLKGELAPKYFGAEVLVRHNPWKGEGLRHPRILSIKGLGKELK